MTATTAHLPWSASGRADRPPAEARDADGAPQPPAPSLRERLCPPMPGSPLAGWLATLSVALLAGVLRFWHVTQPRGRYFDEVYYTKDALGLLKAGYEIDSSTCSGPAYVVHPPFGKWLMAASEGLFGYTNCAGVPHGDPELGWRFSSALFGTLAVLVLARAARRMFRSTVLGCFAGLLLAMDGLEFVQSRIGILDIFLMTGVVVALAGLLLDRDSGRARLVDRLAPALTRRTAPPPGDVGGGAGADAVVGVAAPGRQDRLRELYGPRLGLRPWRLACGVALGLSMGVKWSAVYSIIGFSALAIAWDIGARRTGGARRPVLGALRRDLPLWFAGFVVVPIVVFLATWTGWFVTDGGYDRHFYGNSFVDAWHGWWKYQMAVLKFHEGLDQGHAFASHPMSWLVMGRPVAYYYSSPAYGTQGCHDPAGCSREVLALGNPAVWWVGTASLIAMLVWWVTRRDWRAALVLVGFGSAFLPWLLFPNRTMFFFYALPCLPFLILGITSLAGLALGPRDASDARRLTGALSVGIYTIIVVLLFAYFYPILAAQVIPYSSWRARMWFPGWI
ncbi:phospholipid carrier-dependent glycosyltransferase [Frankia sp. AgB32]|uniref:dolichyl-phosphate-mannose--protein mannosyltransferase n=1 Tax=Frankia sp. AgB32 TaxID=631119 RepID=UPI00200D8B64|nr:phospholipid carrier-dependent glycosyltransferase [Frankia sp. AgB32]MCK9893154.1 phospholipid carrier-dependent glycosyltransferase [Frankia sp. AgB32]